LDYLFCGLFGELFGRDLGYDYYDTAEHLKIHRATVYHREKTHQGLMACDKNYRKWYSDIKELLDKKN